jgi:hypothetical protein
LSGINTNTGQLGRPEKNSKNTKGSQIVRMCNNEQGGRKNRAKGRSDEKQLGNQYL